MDNMNYTNDLRKCGSIGGFIITNKEPHNENGKRYYECVCKLCGTTIWLTHASLKNKVYSDCGCSTASINYKKFIGSRYGFLKILNLKYKKEVIYRDKKTGMETPYIEPIMECKCIYNNCGNIINCHLSSLISGVSKSCGCLAGSIFNFYPELPPKPEYIKGVNNPDIDKYHEAERYNRAQARRKEKNLIVEREGDDIIIKNKKDGRIYPLRWSKEPIEKRHPISFYKIKKEDDDNGKA